MLGVRTPEKTQDGPAPGQYNQEVAISEDGYPKTDGFFQGKSHLEMNDFGYPHLWKPRHGTKGETRTGETQSKLRDAQNDKSN